MIGRQYPRNVAPSLAGAGMRPVAQGPSSLASRKSWAWTCTALRTGRWSRLQSREREKHDQKLKPTRKLTCTSARVFRCRAQYSTSYNESAGNKKRTKMWQPRIRRPLCLLGNRWDAMQSEKRREKTIVMLTNNEASGNSNRTNPLWVSTTNYLMISHTESP